jgi:hypothetical protein
MCHGRLFKELLTTFFVEFLELSFPKLAAAIDPASVLRGPVPERANDRARPFQSAPAQRRRRPASPAAAWAA